MRSLDAASSGDGRNPARGRPRLAGKESRGDVGSHRVPFRALEGLEEVLAVVRGGVVVVGHRSSVSCE
jgi:hypothetical protein